MKTGRSSGRKSRAAIIAQNLLIASHSLERARELLREGQGADALAQASLARRTLDEILVEG